MAFEWAFSLLTYIITGRSLLTICKATWFSLSLNCTTQHGSVCSLELFGTCFMSVRNSLRVERFFYSPTKSGTAGDRSIFMALLTDETNERWNYQGKLGGSQILMCFGIPGGLFINTRLPGSTLGVFPFGLGLAGEFSFLVSSQVLPPPLESHHEDHCPGLYQESSFSSGKRAEWDLV